jgi:hypothetical protein
MTTRGGTELLALPLGDPESASVVPGVLLRGVRVAGMNFRLRIYNGLEKKLRANGYHAGDWNAPKGDGEYFYYPYDWRLSVETSGRRFPSDSKTSTGGVLPAHRRPSCWGIRSEDSSFGIP